MPQERKTVALKVLLAVYVQWFITSSLIRISIAVWLLRLSRSLAWRVTLYAVIVAQTLMCIGYIVETFAVCHPISFYWKPTPHVVCWPYVVGVVWGWTTSGKSSNQTKAPYPASIQHTHQSCIGIMIVLDFMLAIMPIRLVRTLSRPPREKLLICCLMATGLIATAIGCVKLSTFWAAAHTYQLPDQMTDTIPSTLYQKMEELLGIIAACMPCLKRPAEDVLRRIGVLGEVHWPGMSKLSFVFSTRERSVVTPAEEGREPMPLQDVGRLLHKESQGSELGTLGLARTRSMEWMQTTVLESGNTGTNKMPPHTVRMEEV